MTKDKGPPGPDGLDFKDDEENEKYKELSKYLPEWKVTMVKIYDECLSKPENEKRKSPG